MTREQSAMNDALLKVQALEWELRLMQKISARLYSMNAHDRIALLKKLEAFL